MNNISFTVSFVINLIIFSVTTVLVIGLFRRDGNWCLERAKNAFRFFTVQSNVLCAISALAMMIFPAANWAYFLSYHDDCTAVFGTNLWISVYVQRIWSVYASFDSHHGTGFALRFRKKRNKSCRVFHRSYPGCIIWSTLLLQDNLCSGRQTMGWLLWV